MAQMLCYQAYLLCYSLIDYKIFMGICFATHLQETHAIFNKNSLRFRQLLGVGVLGKVWKVTHKNSGEQYAVKVLSKNKILAKKCVKSVLLEKEVHQYLSQFKSDLIVNMIASSQDKKKLYLVMEYIQGSSLRTHIQNNLDLSEAEIKFLILNILKSLEFVHEKRVIHGDVKPENIIIDQQGKPRLMDFGLANSYSKRNFNQTGGTLAYQAPELILQLNHSYSVDFYATGVTAFELFFKKRPHIQTGFQQLKKQILNKEISPSSCPQLLNISKQACDFIVKLLQRTPEKRLGYSSIEEIFQHPWLKTQTQADLQLLNDKSHYLQAFRYSSKRSEITDIPSEKQDDNLESVKRLLDREHIQKKFEPYSVPHLAYPETSRKNSKNSFNDVFGENITSFTSNDLKFDLRKLSMP